MFQGSTAPFIHQKNRFFESTSSISQNSVFAYIFTNDTDIITKLNRNIEQVNYYIMVYNYGTKGAWTRLRHLLLNFGTPSICIYGTAKATNLKLQIDYNEYYSKNATLRDKRGGLGHVTCI